MATIRRARTALNIDRNNTASVMAKTKEMNAGIGGHPGLFGTPSPALAAIMAQAAVVDAAEVLAGTKAKGTAAARNVQRSILVGMLEASCGYVQIQADNASTPAEAEATIKAAGLDVAGVASHEKAVLTATQGAVNGTVALDANATTLKAAGRRKTFFNWQYTADGGKTFVTLPSTPKSKTLVMGLTALSTYGFRVSVTNSDGIPGEWSQIVTFLVLR
jgi:hypothetical protein